MKKYIKIVLMISCALSITNCNVKNGTFSTKNGSYKLKNTKSASSHDPVVYGYLYEYGNKTPLAASGVRIDAERRAASDPVSGKYTISLKRGVYRFTGQGYGYKWARTRPVPLVAGDSLRLDFSLKVDSTPLH